MELTDIRVINVGVLVTADTRPKDLSRVLDQAFEDRDGSSNSSSRDMAGIVPATKP